MIWLTILIADFLMVEIQYSFKLQNIQNPALLDQNVTGYQNILQQMFTFTLTMYYK